MEEDKEFEKLLADFIEKELGSSEPELTPETNSLDGIQLEPCVSQGVTYYVPKACKPEYEFESILVKDDLEDMSDEKCKFSLMLGTDKYQSTIYMQLEDLVLIDPAMRNWVKDVVVLLYRVGNPNPLFACRKNQKEISYSLTINLSTIDGGWVPGEYFLLIANAVCKEEERRASQVDILHSHTRYSFRVLENGAMLEHPVLKDFSLGADRVVEMQLEGATGRLDEYRVQMYSSNWTLMSEIKDLYAYQGKLKTKLLSAYYWTDDTYSLVLVHNGEPCMLVTFDWKDWSLTDYTWKYLESSSLHYILSKYVQKDDYWSRLCKVPGTRPLRMAVLERYGYQLLNVWRTKQDMCRIPRFTHLALSVTDGRYDEDLAYCCAKLLNAHANYKDGNCEQLLENKNSYDPLEDMNKLLDECEDTVICLHHLSALQVNSNGKLLLHLLEEKLQTERRWGLILMGTASEIRLLMEVSSVIDRYIMKENRFEMETLSVQEQVHFLQSHLEKIQLKCTIEALRKLNRMITEHWEQCSEWGREELTLWWERDIYPRFIRRVLNAGNMQDSKQMLYLVQEDDWFWKETATPRNEFMESVQELNGMVGLENLKQNMITLFNRSRFEQARRKMGLPVLEKGGFHMIFTGNPGTGKTTVAKLVGKIFHSLGLLSKGGVVVTERTKLVGRYLGETEKNMVAVLEQAKGNVLFIDEAYSLCDNTTGERKDFGCRVLESLLTVLAQKNPDMIVILAGYEKEMEQMLEMNPGMKGRFPYKFNFEDYNAEELYQIAYNLLNRADYILTPAADERLKEVIRDAVQHKDAFFHNARWVEQLVWDGVVSALSNRLMETPLELEKREVLQRIEVQDIEMGYRKMKPKTAVEGISRRRIGFVA